MIIVYRTENKVNGRFYYGLHTADDKYYLGSGYRLKKAIKKYGKENFIRRTVREFDTVDEAREFEKLVIDAVINNPACYNVNNGGSGAVKCNTPWNKGKKCPGVGVRKPGFVSHHKGKSYSTYGKVAEMFGLNWRTVKRWHTGFCKPNKNNKTRWATYLGVVDMVNQIENSLDNAQS